MGRRTPFSSSCWDPWKQPQGQHSYCWCHGSYKIIIRVNNNNNNKSVDALLSLHYRQLEVISVITITPPRSPKVTERVWKEWNCNWRGGWGDTAVGEPAEEAPEGVPIIESPEELGNCGFTATSKILPPDSEWKHRECITVDFTSIM